MKDVQLKEVGDWTDCGFVGDIDNYQLRMTFTTIQIQNNTTTNVQQQTTNKK